MNISTDYSSSVYSAYSNSTAANSQSSDFADLLMTSLDTDSSGGIDVTEFSEAALSLSSSSADEDSINEAFSLLDDDEDGNISLDELTGYMASGLQNEQMMAAGAGSPPPPPPPPPSNEEEDEGYTVDELSALAEDSASSDADLSALFETLAANFDEADANGDGKVTSAEAMAYKEETSESSSDDATSGENLINSVLQQIIASYNSETMKNQSSFNLSA